MLLSSLSLFSHCKHFHLSIAAMPLSSSSSSNVLRLIIFFTFLTPLVVSSATHNRRILHQPFFPQDSNPPNLPSSPLPPPNYPSTTSTPPVAPFFPFYPSSPPPSPPSPASFPANLSSVVLPYASKSKRASSKLFAAAVAAAAAALVLVSMAVLLHFRKRRTRDCTDTKTRSSACSSRIDYAVAGQGNIPELQRPSQTSSEFLYLGTLVNSHSSIGTDHRQESLLADSSALNSRKSDSPELRPLPLLSSGNPGNVELGASGDDNDAEFFYSPKGSLVGIESSIGTGSASRRDFSTVELEKFIGLCSSSSYSSSESSASGSPNRFLSRSISPPASLSPKCFSLKTPELVVGQGAPLRPPPPPPPPPVSFLRVPLVEVKESQSPSLSPVLSSSPPSSTSPEIVYSRNKDTSPRISNSLDGNLDSSQLITSLDRKKVPPPPPPPPPPLSTPIPQVRRLVSEPPVSVAPMSVEGPSLILPFQLPNNLETDGKALDSNGNSDDNEDVYKLKLKPLHWDKVRASSDREMVWDQLKSSSFRLNEEMFETLFVAKAPIQTPKEAPRWSVLPLPPSQGNRILDPKKSQNIAILLKALNVTVDEVCDALVEGNADSLGTELLESLLKMAPSKEEEQKLKEYKDDSPLKLGAAEKFLKAVLDIPFAFKRVEALLHVSNFESETEYLTNSFQTLEAACEELRNSRMFLKLLEAVLKTGNRMNVGTNRGDAQAFKLDTLLKLVDIKGADGKTTLLHFVVQEIIRSEGARIHNTGSCVNDDLKCRKLGLQVVSNLCSELNNVKKAAVMDSEVLHNDVLKLTNGLENIAEVIHLVETAEAQKEKTEFSMSMLKFIRMSEDGMIRIQAQESVALTLVKEITEYFHGNSAKEEARPFRIFMVVRDFLKVLDRVCKEVGMNCVHKFPVPVNPTLQQTYSGFPGRPPYSCSSDDDTCQHVDTSRHVSD